MYLWGRQLLGSPVPRSPSRIGPMHIPDVSKGQENLSEVLANCKSYWFNMGKCPATTVLL